MSTAAQPVTKQDDFPSFGKNFGTAWIVSVYWARQQFSIANKVRVLRGGRVLPAGYNDYVLEAAPRDGYSLLKVEDGAVHQPDFSSGDDRPPGRIHVPQTGTEIALGLVDKWTGHGMIGAGQIDIALLPNEAIARFDADMRPVPSEEFLERLRKAQEPRAAAWVDKASDYHRTPGKSGGITEHMRDACRWLHGEAANRFDWMHAATMEANKKCVACGREILKAALACEHCQTNIPKFYMEAGYTLEEVREIDPAAGVAVTRINLKRSASIKPAALARQRMDQGKSDPPAETPETSSDTEGDAISNRF